MAYLKEEIKAGVMIVSALLLLSLFTIFIGGSNLFEKFDIYYINVLNVAGLESGAQVKLGGVRVGKVLDVSAPQKAGEKVSVKMGIKQGTAIYEGTEAVISQAGFVGDIYLFLRVDEAKGDRIMAGATIPSIEKMDIAIMMTEVKAIADLVKRLVIDVSSLFSENTAREFEKAVKNTSETLIEIRGLVKDTKGDLSRLLKTATSDLEKAEDMILAIKGAAGEFKNTSVSIDDAVNIQSKNITNLIDTLNRTSEELEEVLQEIKNKPWSILHKEGKAGDE